MRRLTTSSVRRGDLAFYGAVIVVYGLATALAAANLHLIPDRMMVLAERIFAGRLDDPSFAGTVDSVTLGGRTYIAVGPLQVIPYLLFVPFDALHSAARFVVSAVIGGAAACLILPFARAYGARGTTARWVAAFGAFGTLLFYVSVPGDMYYLAHAESFLALMVFLLEWAGRRRPFVLGAALAISALARPTTILAAVPFGLVLVWRERRWLGRGIAFALPLVAAVGVYGAFNAARFGSPFESGYGISLLLSKELIRRRNLGIFSVHQVRENLRLAFLALPRRVAAFPYLLPDKFGMSMALVSPALVLAVYARGRAAIPMVAAAILVAVPVFLYYGGGVVQYGYRYSLDFTPFLLALVAMGTQVRFGRLERALIVVSICSVVFGTLWHVRVFGAP